MRTKRVNRYYCDYCGKSSGAAWAMKRHEEGCTMNPQRTCRVCDLLGGGAASLAELIAMLPDPANYMNLNDGGDEYLDNDTIGKAANQVLPQMQEAGENCPACTMAAIRQAGIPVRAVTEFNFNTEMQEVFDEVNHR